MIRDIKGIQNFELTREELKPFVHVYQEEQSKVINFDPSMTGDDIQDLIDATALDLNRSKAITFQFANGVYNFNRSLRINGFRGDGSVLLNGNPSEDCNTKHTNQAVIFNFTNQYDFGFYVMANKMSSIFFHNLRISKQSLGINDTPNTCIYAVHNGSTYIEIMGCYTSLSDNTGHNIFAHNSTVFAKHNYVSGGDSGLFAWSNSHILTGDNEATGLQPHYGLETYGGGRISKFPTESQPQGSVANEYQGWGTGSIA